MASGANNRTKGYPGRLSLVDEGPLRGRPLDPLFIVVIGEIS